MPRQIPSAWQALIQLAHQDKPWLWCWEITLDSTVVSTPTLAVVNNPEGVTVDSIDFKPFPITHSAIEENGEGDLPQMEVAIDNSTRLIAPYVEITGGLLNRAAKLRLVNPDDFANFEEFDFIVSAASVTIEAAVFRMEVDNWFLRMIPSETHDIHRCRHTFGDSRCGYIINALAAYTACPKHITACIARGDDMAARNLGRRQPESFGAFPGVPTT